MSAQSTGSLDTPSTKYPPIATIPPKPYKGVLPRIFMAQMYALDCLFVRFALSPILANLPTAKEILPSKFINLSEIYLASPIGDVKNKLIEKLPSIETNFSYGLKGNFNWTLQAVSCTVEEFILRFCLQTLLLKEIPKAFLKIVAPNYTTVLDHKIVKTARIILTSILFTLLYIARAGHLPGLLITHTITGLYASYMREYQSASIVELSIMRVTQHALEGLITGG